MRNENNKHSWCVNPYLTLGTIPSGEVVPCCMSFKQYKTDAGNKTVGEESILNFWKSKDRQQFIADLASGKQMPECSNCWKEESAGKESKRVRDNAVWAGLVTGNIQDPVNMYLALGDLCNLKCRICGPDRSSVWVEEESKISWYSNIKLKLFNDPKETRKSFSSSNINFWKDILPLMPTITRIDLSGGEPLYVKNHWKLIKHCVDNDLSKNQIIHYSTNGTIFPEKYISYLNAFKTVEMYISLDSIGQEFNYLRHPGNFVEVDENINKFCQVRDSKITNWDLGGTISISAFSVWNFPATFEYCKSKGITVYVNIVHDTRSMKFLPRKLKDTIIERLLAHTSEYAEWTSQRDQIILYLNNHSYNPILWKLFWKEVRQRDTFRGESFETTFPEYYEAIKPYL